ncbi:M20/M25/M40 family metallo-hydrolase [Paenarthrobacter sp. CM16]|uniref:M20/M25/M40 family metallo-hydrolase n=1 Tax=Paenarthrobacter sp. CM16 TaxID=2738447 RepID=UPI0015533F2D|nr:M20/M25/M40 family metallo-hydrolase [Paenarthrobacter sp. CM16]NQD86471.1 M20/M25/M40 family metallo-hydrolase [Paenarthrobacter sp. CM16]
MPVIEDLGEAVEADFAETTLQLSELVRTPAIAWDAYDPGELDTAASQVAGLLRKAGLTDVVLLQAPRPDARPGAPAVVGRKPAQAGKPTILLYAHYDVQPVGDLALWNSPPFRMVERDGRFWGRGVADNKAGVILHVAALRAVMRVLGDELGVGITVLIDGEEEVGSPSLPVLLQEHPALLNADLVVVADSGNWQVGIPALTTSLRGLISGTIEVRTLEHALHSGTYGGPLLDAATVLSRLITTLHDDDGAVAVRGLPVFEPVATRSPVPQFDETMFRRDARVPPGTILAGRGTLASRLWNKPALSIIGMDVPSIAESSDTLLPVAKARLSLSLAPGTNTSEAMEAVRQHVEGLSPFGADVRFIPGGRTEGFAGDSSSAAAQAMLSAMTESWGVPAVCMGVGGSIPVVDMLARLCPEADVLITGAEDPDSRAHGANESIHAADFQKGIVAEALLLARMNSAP